MKKIIKKYGNCFVITLNKEDMKIYELNLGDIVQVVIRKEKEEYDETSNKQNRD